MQGKRRGGDPAVRWLLRFVDGGISTLSSEERAEWEVAVSLQYDDFDLQITPLPGGKYRVHLNAPSGQSSGDFLLPFTDVDFGNFLGRIGQVRRGTRRSDGQG